MAGKEEFATIMRGGAPERQASEQGARPIQQAVIAHAQTDLSTMPEASGIEAKPAPQAPKTEGWMLGRGHALGMARLGFHEITNALQAFPDSNMKPMEEPGVFGNENAPQRAQDKQNASPAAGKEVSLKDILDAPAPTTPPAEMERDRGREM